MRAKRIRALALAAALVGWSGLVGPRIPARLHPLTNAVLGACLVAVTGAPLGLRPPALWSGLRLGLAVAAPVAIGVAASTALPPVRAAMTERDLPGPHPRWLLLRIPFGTVWSEEAAFRAALGAVAADAFGSTAGRLLQSLAFGLSHIADARSAGEPVIGTVLVTGAAGWVFALLRERSGSLAAPMLAHLAINEAGAVAALVGAAPRLDVAPVGDELMGLGLLVVDAEADDASRGDPDDRGIQWSSAAPCVGLSACSAVPRISRHRTRHGSREAMSSTTKATLLLCARLRYFWLADMR